MCGSPKSEGRTNVTKLRGSSGAHASREKISGRSFFFPTHLRAPEVGGTSNFELRGRIEPEKKVFPAFFLFSVCASDSLPFRLGIIRCIFSKRSCAITSQIVSGQTLAQVKIRTLAIMVYTNRIIVAAASGGGGAQCFYFAIEIATFLIYFLHF